MKVLAIMTDRERSCRAHWTRFGPKHYDGVWREGFGQMRGYHD